MVILGKKRIFYSKKNLSIIVLMLMIGIGFQGCASRDTVADNDNELVNERWLPNREVDLEWINIPSNEYEFISMGLMNCQNGEYLEIEPVQRDAIFEDFGIVFRNQSLYDTTLLLKLFHNYQEVAFDVANQGDYDFEFTFEISAETVICLPITLDIINESQDTINKLTVGMFYHPERFSSQQQDLPVNLRFQTGIMLDFEINHGYNIPLSLSISETLMIQDVYNTGGLFMVNLDNLNSIPERGVITHPPELIQVRPNEELTLSIVGSFLKQELESYKPESEETYLIQIEEYLVISMLDWQQIQMNGAPYIWLNARNRPEYGQLGFFTITTPSEPGLYEFVSFLVHNPRQQFSWGTYYPLEIAIRFTIEVLEE